MEKEKKDIYSETAHKYMKGQKKRITGQTPPPKGFKKDQSSSVKQAGVTKHSKDGKSWN